MATATDRPDPRFAATAIELLQADSILEAAQLCASGVEHYPDYIGGYILLASAYESLGQMHDAQMIREELHTRFPGLPLLKSYVHLKPFSYAPEDVPHIVLESEAVLESEPILESEVDSDLEQSLEIVEVQLVLEEVEERVEEHVEERSDPIFISHPNVLRLIEMAPVSSDTRIIRSASVRLIPGLEFTSLRFEGTRSRGRREITSLLDPPAFRSFHQMRRSARPADGSEPRRRAATLEELAARLHDARMPRMANVEQEESKEDLGASGSPIIVTETIARIYMQQGSYELAIDAFKTLQKQKPAKSDEFEKLIKECERKRS
ncbi:MAG: hypothetical protein ACK45E_04545 [Ignavibacteria bacterium]